MQKMKRRIPYIAVLAISFCTNIYAGPQKVDFSKPDMDGWKSTTSTKAITYSKKRYISGGGGGISGGGGGGRWVTDWQKNKTVTSSVFNSVTSDIGRMSTVKPFAPKLLHT